MKYKKWLLTQFAIVIAAVVLFFALPSKAITGISSASVVSDGERMSLGAEQTGELSAILSDMRASRCFAVRELTEGNIELDVLTPDGPMHITVTGDKGYAYSSRDDALWYRIKDANELVAAVKSILG